MNLFDIVGPVMVGPSSSHTAGAVRIGQVSRHLLGESVKEAKILLHGSFLATGKGDWKDSVKKCTSKQCKIIISRGVRKKS